MTLEQICRLCLCKQEGELMKSIFATDGNPALTYHQFIMTFTRLEIHKDDGLPSNVCERCVDQILNVFSFKKQCENADTSLRRYITNDRDLLAYFAQVNYADVSKNQAISERIKREHSSLKISDKRTDLDLPNFKSEGTSDQIITQSSIIKNEQNYHDSEFKEILMNNDQETQIKNELNFKELSTSNNDIEFENEIEYKDVKMDEFHHDECSSKEDIKYTLENTNIKKKHECNSCGKIFKNYRTLERHKKTHDSSKPFYCKVGKCHWSYATEEELDIHNKLVHLSKHPNGFECAFCQKLYTKRGSLRKHMETHKTIKKYVCKHCGKAFHLRQHLVNHELTHTREFPFLCDDCGHGFINKYELTIHIRHRHIDFRPFSCKECNKTFVSTTRLRIHMKNHSNDIFICSVCGLTCKSQYHLNYHNRRKHKDVTLTKKQSVTSAPAKDKLACNMCGYFAESLQKFDMHVKEHAHQQICPLCRKYFLSEMELEVHMKMHSSGNRSYICKICGVDFNNCEHLEMHILRKHNSSEKPFVCSICPLAFSLSSELKAHSITHNETATFKCKDCGKQFETSTQLRIHTRLHTGDMPFCCEICQKSFLSCAQLAVHIRTHTKKQPNVPTTSEEYEGTTSTYLFAPSDSKV